MLHAITAGTRKNYQAPIRAWAAYRRAQNWPLDEPAEQLQAEAWLAHLANDTTLTARSIRSYKCAVRLHHIESFVDAPIVWDSERIQRLLTGIANSKFASERAAKKLRGQSIALTPEIIAEIMPHLDDHTHAATMRIAAITLASFGMLRPNELLGSGLHPDRVVLMNCIEFFATPSSKHAIADIGPAVPDRYTINLHVTKADQKACNAPTPVAAPIAVAAMHRWFLLRRQLGGTAASNLFEIGGRRLTGTALVQCIRAALILAGYANPLITAKCFRRGGASSLHAAGASPSDIAAMGRWKTQHVAEIYTDDQAREARRVAVSRGMGRGKKSK